MTNEQHLATLNPQMSKNFIGFLKEVKLKLGWDVIITQSNRSFAYQAAIDKKDDRNAEPGLSGHNYGFALDVNFIKGKLQLKKATPKQVWIDSGIIEIAYRWGLRWGGDFYDDKKKVGYYDPIHFDCVKPGWTAKWLAYLKKTYPDTYMTIETNKITWKFY